MSAGTTSSANHFSCVFHLAKLTRARIRACRNSIRGGEGGASACTLFDGRGVAPSLSRSCISGSTAPSPSNVYTLSPPPRWSAPSLPSGKEIKSLHAAAARRLAELHAPLYCPLKTMEATQTPYGPARVPKHFVLCFDGTGNKFSGDQSDSNVLKIFRVSKLQASPARLVVLYDRFAHGFFSKYEDARSE